MKPVKHISITKNMKASDLVEQMKSTAFTAKSIGDASEILSTVIKDKECSLFLGLAGALVPGGMKNIILNILEHTKVFVTTGANLTHDLIEALGIGHLQGNENADDAELHKKGLDRIYNVLMPNKAYEKLESFFDEHFNEFSKCNSISSFLHSIGSKIQSNNSILRKCFEKQIPIFCPAIADSGLGLMIWGRLVKTTKNKTSINAFEDMKEIIDTAWTSKKSAVLYIGGGTPKNFIQQSMQFSKGADYGIQITTDTPFAGGSSGALLNEGISWGKMKKDAKFVNVHCDATVALPLIWSSVVDTL